MNFKGSDIQVFADGQLIGTVESINFKREVKPDKPKPILGIINQTANPLQKDDVVEILHQYYDPTVVGNYVYSARILDSSNPEVMKYDHKGLMLIACYKVDLYQPLL